VATTNSQTVATVVWDILMRPHHRARWETWLRPGLRANGDDDGAQTCIAWVIDDYRYGDIKNEWKQPSSSPSTRSAVQRLFRQGARAVPNAHDEMPLKQLTRSRILTDLVAAFGIADDELDEIRSALHNPSAGGSAHMGPSFHTWEPVQNADDLRSVVQLSRRVIGGHAGFKPDNGQTPSDADIAPLVELTNRRPDAVELCVRNEIDSDHDTLVGYLLAYPVEADIAAGMLNGTITTAVDIDLDQIATTITQESALYIGMVLGADLPARAAVMDWCLHRCTTWAATHRDGYIFAKRSTADGQRWLENYGFVPVTDEDHIWARQTAMPNNRPRRRRLIPASV
jgi:hypothetical protein